MTGKQFQQLRRELGYRTVSELAPVVGYSARTIERWEGRAVVPAHAEQVIGMVGHRAGGL